MNDGAPLTPNEVVDPVYRAAWDRHRRTNAFGKRGLLGPAAFLAIFLVAKALDFDTTTTAFMAIAVALLVGGAFVSAVGLTRVQGMTCPRCENVFNQGRWHGVPYSNGFARRCQTCGLARWAPNGSGPDKRFSADG